MTRPNTRAALMQMFAADGMDLDALSQALEGARQPSESFDDEPDKCIGRECSSCGREIFVSLAFAEEVSPDSAFNLCPMCAHKAPVGQLSDEFYARLGFGRPPGT